MKILLTSEFHFVFVFFFFAKTLTRLHFGLKM
jgi:hypothetical protein